MTMASKCVLLIFCLQLCFLQQVKMQDQRYVLEYGPIADYCRNPTPLPDEVQEDFQALLNGWVNIHEKIKLYSSKSDIVSSKTKIIEETMKYMTSELLVNTLRSAVDVVRGEILKLLNKMKLTASNEVKFGNDFIQNFLEDEENVMKVMSGILDDIPTSEVEMEPTTESIVSNFYDQRSDIDKAFEDIIQQLELWFKEREEILKYELDDIKDLATEKQIELFKGANEFGNNLTSNSRTKRVVISAVGNIKQTIVNTLKSFIESAKCNFLEGENRNEGKVTIAAMNGLHETIDKLLKYNEYDVNIEDTKEELRGLVVETQDNFSQLIIELKYELLDGYKEFKEELYRASKALKNQIPNEKIPVMDSEIENILKQLESDEVTVEYANKFIQQEIRQLNDQYNNYCTEVLDNALTKFKEIMKNNSRLTTVIVTKLQSEINTATETGISVINDLLKNINSNYEDILSKKRTVPNSLRFTVGKHIDLLVKKKK